ncbi:MAG: amidase family protein, partial [bacterium]
MSSPFTNYKKEQLTRRRFLGYFSSIGLTSTLLPGILWTKIQEEKVQKITKEMLTEAENLAGLEFTDEERDLMLKGLNEYLEKYEELRKIPLDNSVSPALQFNPILPGMNFEKERRPFKMSNIQASKAPSNLEESAFWPVTHLSQLIKTGKVSSVELTKMYLERLKKYDPKLQCVISLTEDLALKQAQRADDEIAAGRYRGPLHGIPWGAKD